MFAVAMLRISAAGGAPEMFVAVDDGVVYKSFEVPAAADSTPAVLFDGCIVIATQDAVEPTTGTDNMVGCVVGCDIELGFGECGTDIVVWLLLDKVATDESVVSVDTGCWGVAAPVY